MSEIKSIYAIGYCGHCGKIDEGIKCSSCEKKLQFPHNPKGSRKGKILMMRFIVKWVELEQKLCRKTTHDTLKLGTPCELCELKEIQAFIPLSQLIKSFPFLPQSQ